MSEENKKIENTEEKMQTEPAQEENAQAESVSAEAVCELIEQAKAELDEETQSEEKASGEAEAAEEAEASEEAEAEQTAEAPKGRFRRSRLAAILVAICLLAMVGAGTMAYFVVEDTSFNVITTGGIDIALVETQVDEEGNISEFPGKVEGVMPGQKVSKIVSVKNIGTEAKGTANDVFTRLKLDVKIIDEEKKEDTLDPKNVLLEIDETTWGVKDPFDGYYYYLSPLGPDEITTPLLKNVTLKPEVGNEYMNATITVSVVAEAVQAKNNDKNEETGETGVMAAIGWPEKENP